MGSRYLGSMDSQRVVLITGAAQGCGQALAEEFAAAGDKVVVNDRQRERGQAVADAINAAGGSALFAHADVSDADQVAMLVDRTLDWADRLDCAINNAGVELVGSIDVITPAEIQEMIATNLTGVIFCVKEELRAIRTHGDGGAIVNMSSVTGDIMGVAQMSIYGATKGGVDAFTKSVGLEAAAEGIAINSLAFNAADVPNGMFQRYVAATGTPIEDLVSGIPARRMFTRAELFDTVRFLCSPAARYTVGTTFVVDGGVTSHLAGT